MKNTIRCCISCILPCGALDVIRIVHTNGRVEEISGSNIKAGDIMKAYPKHVLKKPSSPSHDGMAPKIVIVPPEAELRRGKIYFLMPVPSTPVKTRTTTKKKRRDHRTSDSSIGNSSQSMSNTNAISMADLLESDQYLSEILSDKVSTQRDRRRGRVGVWRPHLESISETPI